MAFVGGKGPTDAVAGMDPKFIRQKGQSLAPSIRALRAGYRLPLFSARGARCSSRHQNGYRKESDSACLTYRHLFHSLDSFHLSSLLRAPDDQQVHLKRVLFARRTCRLHHPTETRGQYSISWAGRASGNPTSTVICRPMLFFAVISV